MSPHFSRLIIAFLLLVLSPGFVSAENASTLVLSAPLEWQVSQRRTASEGNLLIAGRCPAGSNITWRLTGTPLSGALSDQWQDILVAPGSNNFAADLRVPAGGWYRLEVRATLEGKVVAEAVAAHVGVGEVFIVAGQSNSGNHGSEKQRTQTGMVVSFDGAKWQMAEDPLAGASGDGGSFMPVFGDALFAKFKVPVGIVPLGIGGTSVREWLPRGSKVNHLTTTGAGVKEIAPGQWESTGEIYHCLDARLKGLGSNGCRAVLWHQGESDAGQARGGYPADRQISGADYVRYMTTLVRASQEAAGWEVPWFSAQTTYHSESDPADEEFRAAQAELWNLKITLQGPDTDTLRAEYRTDVHFNGKGLQKHGELWAERVSPWLDGWLK